MEPGPYDPISAPPSGPLPRYGGSYPSPNSGPLPRYAPDSHPLAYAPDSALLPSPSVPPASVPTETHPETLGGQAGAPHRPQDVVPGQFQDPSRPHVKRITQVSRWLTTPFRNALGHDPTSDIPDIKPKNLSVDERSAYQVAIAAGSRKVNSLTMSMPQIVQAPFPTEEEEHALMAGSFATVQPETPGTYHPPVAQTHIPISDAIRTTIGRTAYDVAVNVAAAAIRPVVAVDAYLNGLPTASADVEVPGYLHHLTSKQLARAIAERLPMAVLSADNWATDAFLALLGLPEGIQKQWHEAWRNHHERRKNVNETKRNALKRSGRLERAQDMQVLIQDALGKVNAGKRVTEDARDLQAWQDIHSTGQTEPYSPPHKDVLRRQYAENILRALAAGDRGTLEWFVRDYAREAQAVANRIKHLGERHDHHTKRHKAKVEASEELNRMITQHDQQTQPAQP